MHIDTTHFKTIILYPAKPPMQVLQTIYDNTNNRVNKIITFNSKDLEFILLYITLTFYYILNTH